MIALGKKTRILLSMTEYFKELNVDLLMRHNLIYGIVLRYHSEDHHCRRIVAEIQDLERFLAHRPANSELLTVEFRDQMVKDSAVNARFQRMFGRQSRKHTLCTVSA
jgi:hypothetical protein